MQNPGSVCLSFNFGQYPFGMLAVGRNWESGNEYRYGFGGMEEDQEIYGEGNNLNFGARIYDSRLGRWFSLDPLMKKYPNYTPYGYTLDNPILFQDIGGKDVAVSIEKNPSGVGGKITFSSTIYVTGSGSDASVDAYNASFTNWAKNGQNTGMYVDENGVEWEVEITMEFKVATDEDVVRIKNASQGAAGENLIEVSPETERAHVEKLPNDNADFQYLPYNEYFPQDKSTEYQLGRRYAQMNPTDGGNTAIHEVLHLYGLTDRYSDGYYEVVDSKTGDFLYYEGVYSHPHVGYENNVMGASQFGEMNLNETQINALARAAFKAQAVEDYNNGEAAAPSVFIMSRLWFSVDKEGSEVSNTYTEDTKTYQNFTYQDF